MVNDGENNLAVNEVLLLTFIELAPLRTVVVSFAIVMFAFDLVHLLATGEEPVLTLSIVAEPSNPPSRPRKEVVCAQLVALPKTSTASIATTLRHLKNVRATEVCIQENWLFIGSVLIFSFVMALAFGFSIVHLVKTLLLLGFHYDSGPAGFKLSFEKKCVRRIIRALRR